MRGFTYWTLNSALESDQTSPDLQIPTLVAVLDPARLRKILRFLSGPPWRWGDLGDVRIRVLRCRSGRCTFEIGLCTTTGAHALIGKVHALDDGSAIFQAMERIRRSGFGPEAEFSIPEPVAYLPALRLLLQEKVEGQSASEVLVRGNEDDRAGASERCARWLARFHARAPKTGPAFDLNNYLIRLEDWLRCTADPADPLSGKLAQPFHCLQRAAPALEPVETCLCHGDFSAGQIIMADGRTATCDWDRCAVSDPNRDLARFLTGLERVGLKHFGSTRALDGAADVFLKTYTGLGRAVSERRLRFYKAAYHLIWMNRKLAKPHWRQKIEATLEDAFVF
jgi:hypothetical protein